MKINAFFRSLIVLAVVSAMTGCTIKAKFEQLEWIRQLTQLKTGAEIREQLWTARIGDYRRTAFPIQHTDRMTFYIEDATEIDFVGWDITALRNWNHYGKSQDIRRTESGLTHHFIDGTQIELTCTPYSKDTSTSRSDLTVYRATCESTGETADWRYTNHVVMNTQGGAVRMLHHIAPDMAPLEMTLDGGAIE